MARRSRCEINAFWRTPVAATVGPAKRPYGTIIGAVFDPGTRSQVELRDTFAFESHSVRHRMSPDLYSVFGAQRILEVVGPNKSKAGFSATGRGSEFAGKGRQMRRNWCVPGCFSGNNDLLAEGGEFELAMRF